MAPPALLGLMIMGGTWVGPRGEAKSKITKEYGFGAPYLLKQIDYVNGRCAICLKNNVHRGVTVPPGYVPTPTGPMHEPVIDFVGMITPVQGKRYILVVVDRFPRLGRSMYKETKRCPIGHKVFVS